MGREIEHQAGNGHNDNGIEGLSIDLAFCGKKNNTFTT